MTSDDHTTNPRKSFRVAKLEEARALLLKAIAALDDELAKERQNSPVVRFD